MPWYLGSYHMFGYRPWLWSLGGFVIPLAIWSGIWTGICLWNAAKRGEKGWFIFFLLVHTAGIVEILYLVFVAKAFTSSHTTQPKQRKR